MSGNGTLKIEQPDLFSPQHKIWVLKTKCPSFYTTSHQVPLERLFRNLGGEMCEPSHLTVRRGLNWQSLEHARCVKGIFNTDIKRTSHTFTHVFSIWWWVITQVCYASQLFWLLNDRNNHHLTTYLTVRAIFKKRQPTSFKITVGYHNLCVIGKPMTSSYDLHLTRNLWSQDLATVPSWFSWEGEWGGKGNHCALWSFLPPTFLRSMSQTPQHTWYMILWYHASENASTTWKKFFTISFQDKWWW